MPKLRNFSKFHGSGNDFILFEDFQKNFPEECVSSLCHRQLGIGADGLILVRHSSLADFEMVFFNPDGSKTICGNGLRCFVHFLMEIGYVKQIYAIEILGRILTAKVKDLRISTFLPAPMHFERKKIFGEQEMYLVDTGVPHLVVFTEEEMDVLSEGRRLRYHEKFHPEGVNVNFVRRIGQDAFQVRTYERGVEEETLSCGTGAAAVAYIAKKLGYIKSKVNIYTYSKEILEVIIEENIEVIGPSVKIFEGWILI